MNLGASLVHASPVSQPDVPQVSAPLLDISHHVSEVLVPVPTPVDTNAPHALDTATPARIGFLSRLFGSNGRRQQEERYITDRRRAVSPDAGSASPSEEQRLLQLQINAEATEQRMITFRMETEIAELDARKAAAEAALAQAHQRAHALERESADNLGGSPRSSPPRGRRSPRRSPSPPLEVAALLQLFQRQQQQAADREQQAADREQQAADREQRREERRDEQRREDRREAAEREERLEARIAEREARLEARLLQTPSTASVGYRRVLARWCATAVHPPSGRL